MGFILRFGILFNLLRLAIFSGFSNDINNDIVTKKHFVLWPKAMIPFYINTKHFDEQQQKTIMIALANFAFKTCLKFVPLLAPPKDDQHVMVFENPSGEKKCTIQTTGHSIDELHRIPVGYNCLSETKLDMVIMRALGFHFEHNRASRNLYIDVQEENIETGAMEMFQKQQKLPLELQNLPYDINSVLHFGPREFSKNGHRTIIFKNPNIEQHHSGLSPLDIRKVELIYGPECRDRDRQEKIELCKKYPGVARRKRDVDYDTVQNLRVNREIKPPSEFKDEELPAVLIELGVQNEVQDIVEQVYKVSAIALQHARDKHCNKTKASLRTVEDVKKSNTSDILGIIENVGEYIKTMVDHALFNLTEFCETPKNVEAYVRAGCPFYDKRNCPQTYRSTKSGPVKYSTQHRPLIRQSTKHSGSGRVKQFAAWLRIGNETIPSNVTSTEVTTEPTKARRKRDTGNEDVKEDGDVKDKLDDGKKGTDQENNKVEENKEDNDQIDKDVVVKGKEKKDKVESSTLENENVDSGKVEKEKLEKDKGDKNKEDNGNVEKEKVEKSKLEKDKEQKSIAEKDKFEPLIKYKLNNESLAQLKLVEETIKKVAKVFDSHFKNASKMNSQIQGTALGSKSGFVPNYKDSNKNYMPKNTKNRGKREATVTNNAKANKTNSSKPKIKKSNINTDSPLSLENSTSKSLANEKSSPNSPERTKSSSTNASATETEKTGLQNATEKGLESAFPKSSSSKTPLVRHFRRYRAKKSKGKKAEYEWDESNVSVESKPKRFKKHEDSDVEISQSAESSMEKYKESQKKKLKYNKRPVASSSEEGKGTNREFIPETVKLSKKNQEFYEDRKWPGGVVYYVIKEDFNYDMQAMRDSLDEVNAILKSKTCVKIKEISQDDANKYEDYLVLDSSPDYVTGRVGGRQHFGVIELFRGGQHRQHTAMMVMAMLGFYFEVSRHDRDEYIRVHQRHVRPDKLHHFEKIRSDATFDLPYDYKSATHPAWQFWRQIGRTGISTVATFKTTDPDGSLMKSLGQNEELLSNQDILKINSVYGIKCFLKHK